MDRSFGDCRLDLERRELFVSGTSVHLAPKAFELLRVLTENQGRAMSKTELFELVWPGVSVSDDSLTRVIAEIRSAIGDNARDPHWLRSLYGFGYIFSPPLPGSQAVPAGSPFALQCGARYFVLSPGEHVIGRDAAVAIPMYSSGVSRRHARIVVTSGGATIEDLGSKNGTYVGETPVSTTRTLHDGDTIRVGEHTLLFMAFDRQRTDTIPA